jgi:hypothetical protein
VVRKNKVCDGEGDAEGLQRDRAAMIENLRTLAGQHFDNRGALMTPLPTLVVENLREQAREFAVAEGSHTEPTLYGVDNGKTIGTYIEQKFRFHLKTLYAFDEGNSASGIDFPSLEVDVKATSIRQPQSSCPYKDASQKIFGLGYAVLVFVYDKTDDAATNTATLKITNVAYVAKEQTGDYQMTRGIREILERDGNSEDLMAFMSDKNLPVDEITLGVLAERILNEKPEQGYLTISNALQWRLQYGRLITLAGTVPGVELVYRAANK